jgi:arabinose-5-phosphate isomerase
MPIPASAVCSPTATCCATLQTSVDVAATRIGDVMSRGPRSIRPDALAAEAVNIMGNPQVNQLARRDARGELVGALNMHDLFRAKVI